MANRFVISVFFKNIYITNETDHINNIYPAIVRYTAGNGSNHKGHRNGCQQSGRPDWRFRLLAWHLTTYRNRYKRGI